MARGRRRGGRGGIGPRLGVRGRGAGCTPSSPRLSRWLHAVWRGFAADVRADVRDHAEIGHEKPAKTETAESGPCRGACAGRRVWRGLLRDVWGGTGEYWVCASGGYCR